MEINEKLARELEKLGHGNMGHAAREGHYSDFNSKLALPKVTLVSELRAIGTKGAKALAERVINGEFDG
jgi:hypothetical protein